MLVSNFRKRSNRIRLLEKPLMRTTGIIIYFFLKKALRFEVDRRGVSNRNMHIMRVCVPQRRKSRGEIWSALYVRWFVSE